MKDTLLHLAASTTKKEAQHLVSLLGFYRQHILQLAVLLLPIHQATWKAASSALCPEQEREGSSATAVPLRPSDPADRMVFEVAVITRMLFGAFARPLEVTSTQGKQYINTFLYVAIIFQGKTDFQSFEHFSALWW